jgi:molybdate transport system ATP-binding protein
LLQHFSLRERHLIAIFFLFTSSHLPLNGVKPYLILIILQEEKRMVQERKLLIEARQLNLKSAGEYLLKDISFSLFEGEALAITGESSSGKTMLGKILAGQISHSSGELILPPDCRKLMISQQHNFRDASSRSYYQQRFDSNYGDESPTVEAELNSIAGNLPPDDKEDFEKECEKIADSLRIQHLYRSRLIELSNGEGKRLQLAKGLLMKPDMIVLDNPFLGLDAETREILHDMINDLIRSGKIIILITSVNEIPEAVTSVMELEKGKIKKTSSRKVFLDSFASADTENKFSPEFSLLRDLSPPQAHDFKVAVEIRNVSVSFGEKQILENISWKVLKGERWGLTGPNGSGKSTLLSLINADNPQGYGNDLWLFDRKKGSGESIWEIKSKIGYISPELHIFFQRNLSSTESLVMTNASQDLSAYAVSGTNAFEAVASGFNDQVGSSQKISSFQKKQVFDWMEILGIKDLAAKPLYKISLGKQRLLLLARALVKNPPLLILDEPCQGLDKEQTRLFTSIVDEVCRQLDKTLIYVSHYPEDFPSCVDRFIRLEAGKIRS